MRQLRIAVVTLSVVSLLSPWAFAQAPSENEAIPPRTDCPPGMHGVPGSVRCAFDTSPADKGPKVKFNPPPPSVIILKPGGVQEQADSCPEELQEVEGYNNWRFCIDPQKPEKIPNLWSPPIAGIPYEKALEIHYRNIDKLSALPGVEGVGLGAEGILVDTTNPELVPQQVEGLRVIPGPVPAGEKVANSHTYNTSVRPLHGAVAAVDNSGGAVTTLTGVVLADGKPWLVFPAHVLGRCTEPPPACSGGIPLNQCEHDNSHGQASLFQSPSGGVNANVGWIQRWTPLGPTFYAADVAAAFMDSDFVEGNGSLAADRQVHSGTSGSIPFSGIDIPPAAGIEVDMLSSLGPPHQLRLRVVAVGQILDNVLVCNNSRANLNNQVRYEVLTPNFTVQSGDSGSPVFDLSTNRRLVGMENACSGIVQSDGSIVCLVDRIYGTDVTAIKTWLKFDTWYGTQTVNDNTIGVFRTTTGVWYVDNGNGKLDATPCTSAAPIATRDQCFGYGALTDVPITGDWDNAMLNSPSNDVTVGAYRPTTDPTRFFLSNTNNPPTTAATMLAGSSSFGYKPVTGKWRGNNGASNATSKVGVFRPSTGGWYLDSGNLMVEGCGTDYCFSLAAGMYQAGDTPIAGDWNNDGFTSIGVFRRGIGTAPDYFYLSNVDPYTVRNNGTISSWTYAIPSGPGNFGYLPVVGNWTGTGGSKLGIFRPSTGGWYLDNGNRVFPGCAEDQCPTVFGTTGDKPVAFGKSIVKAN